MKYRSTVGWLKEWFDVLTAKNGATMETDLEETPTGWVARYLIVRKDLGGMKPQRQVFASKADAVAWLSAEAAAHGFVYETGSLVGWATKCDRSIFLPAGSPASWRQCRTGSWNGASHHPQGSTKIEGSWITAWWD